MIASTFILIVGVTFFWKSYSLHFNPSVFFVSLIPMILETAAKNFIREALDTRADPNRIFAIVEINNVLLVIIECIRM